jgi:hypothetical protein
MHEYKSCASYLTPLLHRKYEACSWISPISFHFGYFSLQCPVIKILRHYRCLSFGCDPGIVIVNLVICTNTNHVHPTWLTAPSLGFVCSLWVGGMFLCSFWLCSWLNCCGTTSSSILDVIPWVVHVNHVCTNTNLMHPTWFTRSVPRIMCPKCKYEACSLFSPILMFILVLFCCNRRWLNCCGTTSSSISMWSWDGASEPHDMHNNESSSASYLVHLPRP